VICTLLVEGPKVASITNDIRYTSQTQQNCYCTFHQPAKNYDVRL